jgi:hypothetical protein
MAAAGRQLSRCGNDVESSGVLRPKVVEVTAIQGRHRGRPDALSDRNDRCVRSAEPPVGVSTDQLGHSSKISIHELHEPIGILAGRADVVEKRCFGLRPEFSVDEIARLGEHRGRHEQRRLRRRKPLAAPRVVLIVPIGERHENVRVDDDHVALPAKALGEDVVDLLRKIGPSACPVSQRPWLRSGGPLDGYGAECGECVQRALGLLVIEGLDDLAQPFLGGHRTSMTGLSSASSLAVLAPIVARAAPVHGAELPGEVERVRVADGRGDVADVP